jgi:hypothetical protein
LISVLALFRLFHPGHCDANLPLTYLFGKPSQNPLLRRCLRLAWHRKANSTARTSGMASPGFAPVVPDRSRASSARRSSRASDDGALRKFGNQLAAIVRFGMHVG